MRISRRFVQVLSVSFLLALCVATPAIADDLRFSGDHSCPAEYPIKQAVIDVAANTYTTICITQYQWNIELIGGDTYQKWITSGKTYDASADIAAWKLEKAGIELLRTTAEAEAKSDADANPGMQVCKSWNYTSVYNGSGGGSICTITPNPADGFTDEEFGILFAEIRAGFENDPQYAQLRRQIDNRIEIYTPQERAETLDSWATWTAATQLAKQHAQVAAQSTPGRQRCVFWNRNNQSGQECAQVPADYEAGATDPVVAATSSRLSSERRLLIKLNTLVATVGTVSTKTAKYLKKLDRAIPNTTTKARIKLPKTVAGIKVKATVVSGACAIKGSKLKLGIGQCDLEFAVTTTSGLVHLEQSIIRN